MAKSYTKRGKRTSRRRGGRRLTTTSSNKRMSTVQLERMSAKQQKTTTKKAKKRQPVSGAQSHHAVRMRPFSNATSQPKIPDGSLTSSLSRRLQNVVQISNANGTLGSNIMHMIFAPTLGVPIAIANTVNGATYRGLSSVDPSFIGFPNQTVGFEASIGPNFNPSWPLDVGQTLNLTNTSAFSKWRIVSQGLRMELNAVDDENDGWFEVCRFNWRNDNEDLVITSLDNSLTDNKVGFAPSPNVPHLFDMAMVEQPGYKTGLLKDIKKYEFMLHPQKGDHDPVNLEHINSIKEGVDCVRDSNTKYTRLNNTSNSSNLKNQVVDHNMDWIYIRFHPRNATAPGGGSKLIVNAIQNLEIAFDPQSDFAAFQTLNKADKKVAAITDSINNNPDGMNRRRK